MKNVYDGKLLFKHLFKKKKPKQDVYWLFSLLNILYMFHYFVFLINMKTL